MVRQPSLHQLAAIRILPNSVSPRCVIGPRAASANPRPLTRGQRTHPNEGADLPSHNCWLLHPGNVLPHSYCAQPFPLFVTGPQATHLRLHRRLRCALSASVIHNPLQLPVVLHSCLHCLYLQDFHQIACSDSKAITQFHRDVNKDETVIASGWSSDGTRTVEFTLAMSIPASVQRFVGGWVGAMAMCRWPVLSPLGRAQNLQHSKASTMCYWNAEAACSSKTGSAIHPHLAPPHQVVGLATSGRCHIPW